MTQPHRYVIGIDLGTTNSAVAYVDLERAREAGGRRAIELFRVPQLVAPGELDDRATLPSFCYLAGGHDLPPKATVLPWDATRDYAVGVLARDQGARVPGRLVGSAKSWLSHGGVDRTKRILPWDAPDDVEKLSPVEASRRYLQHLREAWDERMAAEDPACRLARQLVVLTVPASFDEVARELTVRAAREAGIDSLVLLEEPLAAFYAWMDTHPDERDGLEDGALALVCDVGGGTTDFSVVAVRREAGVGPDALRFDRLAVGDHLMLGGDNMDHALARLVETQLLGGAGRLELRRWHQLVHQSRAAKEQLLGEDPPEEVPIVVADTGSKLVGSALRGVLKPRMVERVLVDGFFPEVDLDEPLQAERRAGLTELGLPYERDPAITRQLAAFWRRYETLLRETTGREAPRPDYLLFNGGALTPASLRDRLRSIVGGWFEGGWRPGELTNPRPDLAVAFGAAYYGLVRLGEGTRVGSGLARAYYVGVAGADGADDAQTAVCLVPRGAEEGFYGRLSEMPVAARTNQPVTFHLFTAATRTGDAFGDVVRLGEEAEALPPTRTVLKFGRKGVVRDLPVELTVHFTEIGTLELWCASRETDHRWRLDFDVRGEDTDAPDAGPAAASVSLETVEAAADVLRGVFEGDADPEGVWDRLEDALDASAPTWPLPAVRKLADVLLNLPRDRSAEHEAAWFDLLGYTLRPGYGDAVDEWRLGEAWKRYMEGLHFDRDAACRRAWWRFWRRAGGGLPEAKQAQVYYDARPYIQLKVKTRKKHPLYPRRLDASEKLAAWRALATFERLPTDIRLALGRLVLESIRQDGPDADELWAVARLGARRLVYGPLENLVPAEDAALWLRHLVRGRLPKTEDAAWALVHLAQRTGDRQRDVPKDIREEAAAWLGRLDDGDRYLALIERSEHGPLDDAAAYAWLLGEPRPPEGAPLEDPTAIVVEE